MNDCNSMGLFVAFSILNHPALPVIRNTISRQKVGFYFLTNVE